MSGHTPGPWTDEGGYIMARILPDRRVPKRAGHSQQQRIHIAHISNSPPPHMLEGEPEANARLIAAAPELLAACKMAWDADDGENRRYTETLLAAIAKAEGKP